MSDFHIKPNTCKACGYQFDGAATIVGDARPNPGDYSVCLKCTDVAVFDEQLNVRPATAEEREAARTNPEVRRIIRAIKLLHMLEEKQKGSP